MITVIENRAEKGGVIYAKNEFLFVLLFLVCNYRPSQLIIWVVYYLGLIDLSGAVDLKKVDGNHEFLLV